MPNSSSCGAKSFRRTQRTLWLSRPTDRAILVERGVLPVRRSPPVGSASGMAAPSSVHHTTDTLPILSPIVGSPGGTTLAGSGSIESTPGSHAGCNPVLTFDHTDGIPPSSFHSTKEKKTTEKEHRLPSTKKEVLPNEPLQSLRQAKDVIETLTSLFPVLPSRELPVGSSSLDVQLLKDHSRFSSIPRDAPSTLSKTVGDGIAWIDFVHPTAAEMSTVLSWLAPSLPHLMVGTQHWIYLHEEDEQRVATPLSGERDVETEGNISGHGGGVNPSFPRRAVKSSSAPSLPLDASSSPLPRCNADYYWNRSTASDMNHLVFYPSYGYGLLRFTALRASEEEEARQEKEWTNKPEYQQQEQRRLSNNQVGFSSAIPLQHDSSTFSSSSVCYEEDKEQDFSFGASSDPFAVVSCILLDRAMITFRNGYFKDEDEVISELQWCFGYYTSATHLCAQRSEVGDSLPKKGSSVLGTPEGGESSSSAFSSRLPPAPLPSVSSSAMAPSGSHQCFRSVFFSMSASSRLPRRASTTASSPSGILNRCSNPRLPFSSALSLGVPRSNIPDSSAFHRAYTAADAMGFRNESEGEHITCISSSDSFPSSSPLFHPDYHLIPLLVSTIIGIVVDELKQATIPLLIETNRVDELALSMRPSPEDQEDLLRRMRSVRHRIHQWHIQLLRKESLLQQLLASTQNGAKTNTANAAFHCDRRVLQAIPPSQESTGVVTHGVSVSSLLSPVESLRNRKINPSKEGPSNRFRSMGRTSREIQKEDHRNTTGKGGREKDRRADEDGKDKSTSRFPSSLSSFPPPHYTTLEGEVVARYIHALTLTKLAIESIRRGRDTINFSSMSVISGVVAQLGEHGHLTDYWNTLQAIIALLVMPVNIIPGIMSCNFAVPFENSTNKNVFWIIIAITIGMLLLGLAYPLYCTYRYKLPGSIAPL